MSAKIFTLSFIVLLCAGAGSADPNITKQLPAEGGSYGLLVDIIVIVFLVVFTTAILIAANLIWHILLLEEFGIDAVMKGLGESHDLMDVNGPFSL